MSFVCVASSVATAKRSTTASSRGRSFPFLRALSSSDGSRSHVACSSTGLAAAIPAAITADPTRAAERATPPPVAAPTIAAAGAAARVSGWLGWDSVHWDGSPLASVFPAAHPGLEGPSRSSGVAIAAAGPRHLPHPAVVRLCALLPAQGAHPACAKRRRRGAAEEAWKERPRGGARGGGLAQVAPPPRAQYHSLAPSRMLQTPPRTRRA